MAESDILLRIRELFDDSKLTQEQFANKLGIDQSNFSKLLKGQRTCGKNTKRGICSSLGVNLEWLENGMGEKYSVPEKRIEGTENEKIYASCVLQRIIEFFNTLSINKTKFAKEINIPQNSVNQYLSGSRSISFEFINNILIRYNDVSAEWIMRGDGGMFKKENNEKIIELKAKLEFAEKIISGKIGDNKNLITKENVG